MKNISRMSSNDIIVRITNGKCSKSELSELESVLERRGVQIKYKLTTQELTTYKGFQWAKGKTFETSGEGELCSPGWLHYYHHPLLATLLNPIHADISDPKLWVAKCEGTHLDDYGLKGGCTKMTLIKEIPLHEMTMAQRVAFGILCAMEICDDAQFQRWANAWLDDSDRSETAAVKTIRVIVGSVATKAAAKTAAKAAAYASSFAATYASSTSVIAEVSVYAAYATYYAASAKNLDLIKIANEALKY